MESLYVMDLNIREARVMSAVLEAPPSPQRGAIGLLLLVGAFTAFWLVLNVLFPTLQSTGIAFVVVRSIIHVAILTGLWLGLALTKFETGARVRIWLTFALVFTAWLGLAWWLAIAGAFRGGLRSGVPALPVAIFLPVLIGLPLLVRSTRIGALLEAMPTSWLVGLQVYRVFGGIFLVAWGRGSISGAFALPAGTGDVLVGLLALPVAHLLHRGAAAARGMAIAWNVLGLVDFTIAIGMGILTTPGPLQLIVPDVPNTQLGTFPMVMIPTFAVPSSILLHALSLRQLWRRAGRLHE